MMIALPIRILLASIVVGSMSCSEADPADRFRIDKYYVDVVTDTGRGAYFHVLRGSYRGFTVEATATHQVSPLYSIASENVLRHVEIEKRDSAVTFKGLVEVDGPLLLEHLQPAAKIELYRDEIGSVTWEAFASAADVRVYLGTDTLAGRGYAERLVMTTPPWKVPVDRHWWGRTLTDSLSLIWLVWEGPEERTIGLVNAIRQDSVLVDEGHVEIGRYRITHLDTVMVSQGSVMEHSLRDLGAIREVLPGNTWDLHEHRWLCRSEIRDRRSQQVIDTAWTLHERIDWQRTSK